MPYGFFEFYKRLIFKLVWETNPWILIALVLIALLNGVLPIVGAYISKEIINKLAMVLQDKESITLAAIGVLFVFQFAHLFLNRVITDVNRIVTSLGGELVANHIRRKIMSKAKEIDVARFDLPEFYETLENANREAGMRPVQILNSTLSIISVLISVVGFVVILAGISAWAPVLVAALALPSAIISFVFRKKTVSYMRLRSKSRRQMNYYSSLTVDKDLVKEIRLLGMGDELEERYDVVFRDYYKGVKKLILQEGAWNIGFGMIKIVANCFLFFYIASRVFEGMPIGDYSLYTGALNSISSGMGQFVSGIATIYEGTLFIDNLISYMKCETMIRSGEQALRPQKGTGHTIEFRDVGFMYPGKDHFVLRHINLTLHPDETVALVGLNGAGKTTLIKLLTRLYDPTEGTILLDGHDLREYDLSALYDLYGIVFQDFGKYAFSLRENIRFGEIKKPEDEERILSAARQSDAWSFIRRLPRGIDTPLMRYFEEDGLELSGGQWQKVAVARAFYGENDILILDEPTAALDALAEQEIFRQFEQLRRGKTTVFVSHRLSSAVTADRIVVLGGGSILGEALIMSFSPAADATPKCSTRRPSITAKADKYFKKKLNNG